VGTDIGLSNQQRTAANDTAVSADVTLSQSYIGGRHQSEVTVDQAAEALAFGTGSAHTLVTTRTAKGVTVKQTDEELRKVFERMGGHGNELTVGEVLLRAEELQRNYATANLSEETLFDRKPNGIKRPVPGRRRRKPSGRASIPKVSPTRRVRLDAPEVAPLVTNLTDDQQATLALHSAFSPEYADRTKAEVKHKNPPKQDQPKFDMRDGEEFRGDQADIRAFSVKAPAFRQSRAEYLARAA